MHTSVPVHLGTSSTGGGPTARIGWLSSRPFANVWLFSRVSLWELDSRMEFWSDDSHSCKKACSRVWKQPATEVRTSCGAWGLIGAFAQFVWEQLKEQREVTFSPFLVTSQSLQSETDSLTPAGATRLRPREYSPLHCGASWLHLEDLLPANGRFSSDQP